MLPGIDDISDHIDVGLIINSETVASLAAFLLALVSVLALLNPVSYTHLTLPTNREV